MELWGLCHSRLVLHGLRGSLVIRVMEASSQDQSSEAVSREDLRLGPSAWLEAEAEADWWEAWLWEDLSPPCCAKTTLEVRRHRAHDLYAKTIVYQHVSDTNTHTSNYRLRVGPKEVLFFSLSLFFNFMTIVVMQIVLNTLFSEAVP